MVPRDGIEPPTRGFSIHTTPILNCSACEYYTYTSISYMDFCVP